MVGARGSLDIDTAVSGRFVHYGDWDKTWQQFGPDALLWLDVPVDATRLVIDTLSTPADGVADTILTVLSACPRGMLPLPALGPIARNDDAFTGELRSRIELSPPPAGRIYVHVDGYSVTDAGVITVRWEMEMCGPGRRALDEPMPVAAYPATPGQTELLWSTADSGMQNGCLSPTASATATRSVSPTTSPSNSRPPSRSPSRTSWPTKARGRKTVEVSSQQGSGSQP